MSFPLLAKILIFLFYFFLIVGLVDKYLIIKCLKDILKVSRYRSEGQ